MRSLYALVVCAGCGFQVSAGSGAPGDGRIDSPFGAEAGEGGGGGDASDAPVDGTIMPGTMCMMKWMMHTVTLSAPVPLTALDTANANERDPFLTNDGLSLYYATDATGGGDIYVATRASTALPFAASAAVTELNTSDEEGRATLTNDGKVVIFASTATNNSATDVDLWQATRGGNSGPFGASSRSPFLFTISADIDDQFAQRDPELTGDGKHLYFSNGSPQKIVEVSRGDSSGDFGSTQTTIIESGFGDADPALSGDQKLILFTSSRSGGPGQSDIWYATRAGAADPFDPAMVVPTINSSTFDGDPTLSNDGCTVFFASSRAGGSFDLYYAVVL